MAHQGQGRDISLFRCTGTSLKHKHNLEPAVIGEGMCLQMLDAFLGAGEGRRGSQTVPISEQEKYHRLKEGPTSSLKSFER